MEVKLNTALLQLKSAADLCYSSYRRDGERLVQDAVVHQLLVDVTGRLANALQTETRMH